ncbi:MAG: hypothetical protein OXQ84_20885 [bacterium]|nr:hypothetical protein [bacterium]
MSGNRRIVFPPGTPLWVLKVAQGTINGRPANHIMAEAVQWE